MVEGASPWLANAATKKHNSDSVTGNGVGTLNDWQNDMKCLTAVL